MKAIRVKGEKRKAARGGQSSRGRWEEGEGKEKEKEEREAFR